MARSPNEYLLGSYRMAAIFGGAAPNAERFQPGQTPYTADRRGSFHPGRTKWQV